MLKATHVEMQNEIKDAEVARDRHLRRTKELVKKYATPDFGMNDKANVAEPENRSYEFISLVLPKIAYENPRTIVRSWDASAQGRMAAGGIRHGLNAWTRREKLREPLQEVATDMLFGFAASTVTLEPLDDIAAARGRYEPHEDKMIPHFWHIEPSRFIYDPVSTKFSNARFSGITQIIDAEDLREIIRESDPEDGWNKKHIDQVVEAQDKVRKARGHEAREQATSDRGEMIYHEIWVPEVQQYGYDQEDGYHGSIYTIVPDADFGEDGWLRDPRPYYGPRWGPNQFYGVYPVPGSSVRLSPLVATSGQQDNLNEWTRATDHASKQYKRIIITQGGNKGMVNALQAPDMHVMEVPMMDKDSRPYTLEVGGVTAQHILWAEQLRERTDRAMGMDEVVRGTITGAGTATEAAIADNASSVRLSFIKQQLARGVRQAMHTAGWFMYYEEGVQFKLGDEALQEIVRDKTPVMNNGQSQQAEPNMTPVFKGGLGSFQDGMSYDDLEIEIDIQSMERSNEALERQRFLELFGKIIEMAGVMEQAPWLGWDRVIEQAADAYNQPGLEDIIDMRAMRAHFQQKQQMEMAALQAKQQQQQQQQSEAAAPGKAPGRFAEAQKRGQAAAQARTERQ